MLGFMVRKRAVLRYINWMESLVEVNSEQNTAGLLVTIAFMANLERVLKVLGFKNDSDSSRFN